jgi:hypothetical protein
LDINTLIQESWQTSEDHGFHDDQHDGAEYDTKKLTLMIEEIIEAFGELRDGHAPTEIYWKCKECKRCVPEDTDLDTIRHPESLAHYTIVSDRGSTCYGEFKPEGVPIEQADLIIRAADYAAIRGFDLVKAIEIKAAYNKTRPFKHGRQF